MDNNDCLLGLTKIVYVTNSIYHTKLHPFGFGGYADLVNLLATSKTSYVSLFMVW